MEAGPRVMECGAGNLVEGDGVAQSQPPCKPQMRFDERGFKCVEKLNDEKNCWLMKREFSSSTLHLSSHGTYISSVAQITICLDIVTLFSTSIGHIHLKQQHSSFMRISPSGDRRKVVERIRLSLIHRLHILDCST